MPAEASMWTAVGAHRVHARSWPAPSPEALAVVLVHGMVVSSAYMVPTARRLARDFRVYAPDMPGYGLSSKPAKLLDVGELADVLAEWMEAAGLDRPFLLANSFGCQVVLELGARHPQVVGRSMLIGPTMDPRARNARVFWRWFRDWRFELRMAPILLRDFFRAGPRRTLHTLRLLLNHRPEDAAPRFRSPALLVRGSLDPIAPRRWLQDLASRMPDARVLEIPGAPHAANFTSPLEIARVARAFFQEAPQLEPILQETHV